jgi:hypothetical protein
MFFGTWKGGFGTDKVPNERLGVTFFKGLEVRYNQKVAILELDACCKPLKICELSFDFGGFVGLVEPFILAFEFYLKDSLVVSFLVALECKLDRIYFPVRNSQVDFPAYQIIVPVHVTLLNT